MDIRPRVHFELGFSGAEACNLVPFERHGLKEPSTEASHLL